MSMNTLGLETIRSFPFRILFMVSILAVIIGLIIAFFIEIKTMEENNNGKIR